MVKVAVVGASGYVGAELLRLCAAHPDFEVVVATGDTLAGQSVAATYPSLALAYPDLAFSAADPSALAGADLVLLALPHGASQKLVPILHDRVGVIIDLAADFRLRDPALYAVWYGEEHRCPDLLAEFTYGIPELFPGEVAGARLIAAAGCYVTAAALALAPLVRAGAIEATGVIVDAASGVSGAGRAPKPTTHFSTVNEDFDAYGHLTHRHT
ncbi:MAG: N-acetyl-gamma-glutamyl-phosphate reductase, partial [Acidimicrobiales bacterium]